MPRVRLTRRPGDCAGALAAGCAERPLANSRAPSRPARSDPLVCAGAAAGCQLPAVVVNGGCCRAEVSWTWPAGVPVVLITGGRDFFNEHLFAPGMWDLDADLSYRRELWANVPPANRATTTILHLPNQKHNMSQAVLTALLPQAVALATSALAATARPDGRGLPQGEPLVIVSADTAPEGVLLCGELEEPPPPPPPPPPPVWAGCVQRCFGTLST